MSAPTHAGPTLVDTPRAAEMLGLTKRALEERRRRGGGPPYVRLSPTCVRYRLSDLESWIEERTHRSTADESVHTTDPAA